MSSNADHSQWYCPAFTILELLVVVGMLTTTQSIMPQDSDRRHLGASSVGVADQAGYIAIAPDCGGATPGTACSIRIIQPSIFERFAVPQECRRVDSCGTTAAGTAPPGIDPRPQLTDWISHENASRGNQAGEFDWWLSIVHNQPWVGLALLFVLLIPAHQRRIRCWKACEDFRRHLHSQLVFIHASALEVHDIIVRTRDRTGRVLLQGTSSICPLRQEIELFLEDLLSRFDVDSRLEANRIRKAAAKAFRREVRRQIERGMKRDVCALAGARAFVSTATRELRTSIMRQRV